MKRINIFILISIILLITIIVIQSYYFMKSNNYGIHKDKLANIEIVATPEQLDFLRENTEDEPYIKVDVIINGELLKDCGLRTKGKQIYSYLEKVENHTRFGYRLDLDYYVSNQSYDGVTKISLNSGILDKTCIREMVCYDIYEIAGVNTVKRCLCDLTIGGKDEGIYTFVEIPTENYIARYSGNSGDVIYKAKSKLNGKNNNVLNIDRIKKAERYGNDTEENEKTILKVFEKIENNIDFEKHVDVSKMIDYLAVCFLIDNEDSYLSGRSRNYFIYQSNDVIYFLPYDFNMYFWKKKNVLDSVFSYRIYHSVDRKPMIYNILNDSVHIKEYTQKISNIINTLENESYIYKRIDKYKQLVNDSLKYNRNNYYTYEEFCEAVPAFKEIMKMRLEIVKGQLIGSFTDIYETFDESILLKINDYETYE